MALNRLKSAIWLAALSAATLGAPGAAHAQFYFDSWGGRFSVPLDDPYDRDFDRRPYRDAAAISRGQVAAMLTRRGYRVNPSIARNDDVYLVDAVDPAGRRVRLVVDAFDASIIQRSVVSSEPPRAYSRFEDDDRWGDGDAPSPPRVIPGMGPAQKKPAPKKPATARVEPRAPAPRATTTTPSPTVQPPATAPAPSTPGPAAAAPARPAPETRAEAPKVIPAPAAAAAEPAPPAQPRVIPLYKTPAESGADAEKPAEGAP